LCIRRTLANGRIAGLISGLGVASADAVYGLIIAFGFTFVADLLNANNVILSMIGAAVLLYMGWGILRSHPPSPDDPITTIDRRGLFGMYASTFFLALTNPITMAYFASVFVNANIDSAGEPWLAALIVFGVFMGSMIWWTFLSVAVSVLRDRFRYEWLLWINRISGIAILIFAVVLLFT
jgi:threonine/homoserine/homoserine lactone efflux protein